MSSTPVIVAYTYQAPIQKVWEALTDAARMKAWYFDIADFRPEPGFKFGFVVTNEGKIYDHRCEVLEATAPNKLTYSWRYEGYPGLSVVTFALQALTAETTQLRLTHSGLDTFPADQPAFSAASFTAGWQHILGTSLADYVITGA
ncbi:SRPBCC family protein [Chitinophaga nivalis]|uniref:SRPBCC domain-containing protein n=1 Tax=Chitinophaga nivalis TaxID=2991709 RepID=A0ABT3IM70_9BACT|nr:SRPBCC domain-containing protein [Chitinophaga nivalis]MCW3465234.1 SRPBCC domain-containing protein [Chitinophaga nivalis]MCW3485074.1 SRPBCC domain-containing protein [Chitinophaga nivalis]